MFSIYPQACFFSYEVGHQNTIFSVPLLTLTWNKLAIRGVLGRVRWVKCFGVSWRLGGGITQQESIFTVTAMYPTTTNMKSTNWEVLKVPLYKQMYIHTQCNQYPSVTMPTLVLTFDHWFTRHCPKDKRNPSPASGVYWWWNQNSKYIYKIRYVKTFVTHWWSCKVKRELWRGLTSRCHCKPIPD